MRSVERKALPHSPESPDSSPSLDSPPKKRWGNRPWTIDFQPAPRAIPEAVDFAIVGGGFSGLAAAAWLRRTEPGKSVALFEAETLGAGSSGHTGGMALGETAAGDLPGLGDVLDGFQQILRELGVDGDLALPGAWELAHNRKALPNSPIAWRDSGDLCAVAEVRGGSVNPGKVVSGLARAADRLGAMLFENARVEDIAFEDPLRLEVAGKQVRAQRVLVATNAESLELNGLAGRAEPKFTLALATEPVGAAQIEDLGLASGKSFYTVDLPYLWGRLLGAGQIIFGCGLVHLNDWRELATLDISSGEASELFARLERRVHGLHPALRSVKFTHRWGGPILIAEEWQPVFAAHPRSPSATVLGAFSGHGVALSVYLGRWAAEAVLGRRKLPEW
jgi:glycine/D-amino acid oxidase-like deaminating enzyme